MHTGQNAVCLEKAGLWELTPDPQFFKLAQSSFEIDTSKANHIDLAPKYMALEGVFRFESELFVDEVGLRINGQEFT